MHGGRVSCAFFGRHTIKKMSETLQGWSNAQLIEAVKEKLVQALYEFANDVENYIVDAKLDGLALSLLNWEDIRVDSSAPLGPRKVFFETITQIKNEQKVVQKASKSHQKLPSSSKKVSRPRSKPQPETPSPQSEETPPLSPQKTRTRPSSPTLSPAQSTRSKRPRPSLSKSPTRVSTIPEADIASAEELLSSLSFDVPSSRDPEWFLNHYVILKATDAPFYIARVLSSQRGSKSLRVRWLDRTARGEYEELSGPENEQNVSVDSVHARISRPPLGEEAGLLAQTLEQLTD
jgi:hypothetical protein